MTDAPGPETLRVLATSLRTPIAQSETDALLAHADAWAAERAERAALAEQLAEAHKKVETFERDRKWWQDNAIRRHKRAEARRSGGR